VKIYQRGVREIARRVPVVQTSVFEFNSTMKIAWDGRTACTTAYAGHANVCGQRGPRPHTPATPANPVQWVRSHDQLTLSSRKRKRAARSKARLSFVIGLTELLLLFTLLHLSYIPVFWGYAVLTTDIQYTVIKIIII